MSTELVAAETVPPARPLQPLAIFRRRRMAMLIAAGVALVIATPLALLWPPIYISTGTILIEQQELPTDLVRSTISSFADQRIQIINQRVMTTDNLLRIVQRYDLYPQERRKQGRESIVAKMRDDIQFRTIKADVIDPRQGRPQQATIAFSVGFQSRSSETAARVANELASLYLQENLESRKQLSENATSFLSSEAGKLSARIAELETQVASFKEKHVDNLPDLGQLNIQLLNRTEDERRDVDSQLRTAEQQLVFLDAQLAQINPTAQIYTSTGERVMSPQDRLKALRSEYARVSALYSADHPDVIRLKRQIEGMEGSVGESNSNAELARQLLDARSQLAAARQRYGADHPDVKALERLVAGIEAQATQVTATANATAKAADDADNPAFIQLRAQRESAQLAKQSQEARRASLNSKQAELEKRLAAAPAVEQEYAVLSRELEGTKAKYREVQQKEMEAQLAQTLEAERKGERFTLIEPPLAPQEPTSPNRQLILLFGVVLALVAALGIAFALDLSDGRVRDRADIIGVFNLAPLAVVPWMETQADRLRQRQYRRYAMGGAVVTLLVGMAFVHLFYRPLDVLWAVAMRRLGG